jgi:hypothetical protein
VSHSPRTLVACAALAAGLWTLAVAEAADAPEPSKDAFKKAADADLKFLQTRAAELAKKAASGAKTPDGQVKPAIGTALTLAAYSDAVGDAALKPAALKVADLLSKKDFKGADAAAQKLAVKPGAPGKLGTPPKPFKDETMLDVVMSPFRGAGVGGLGIEKDIQDALKAGAKFDPAALELLGVRVAVLNSYGQQVPNDKATVNAANTKLWAKWSSESVEQGKLLAAEAAKAKPDDKKLKTILSAINAKCVDCHEKFRD